MIDRETVPSSIWISMKDDKKCIELLRKNFKDKVDDTKELLISEDLGQFDTAEYYFDSDYNEIHYTGELLTSEGKIYCSIQLPLSDEVLIDILEHSVKKLNKLKTALETLK